jgi:hypothetical protein
VVVIDSRFGHICTTDGSSANVSFIDDDQVASYYFSLGTDTGYVSNNTSTISNLNNGADRGNAEEAIAGPRGTILNFKIRSTLELSTSDYLFDKLGSTLSPSAASQALISGQTHKYIDTLVRVTGATTGYRVDIPVRFLKYISG